MADKYNFPQTIIATISLAVSGSLVNASQMVCTHPEKLNHTYSVAGDAGVYTWDDHGIKRSMALKCGELQSGSIACHRWERYGEEGRSVMIFRMLADGTLIEARSWGMIDASMISAASGFVCTTESD